MDTLRGDVPAGIPSRSRQGAKHLPTTPLVEAVRTIALEGITVGDLGFEFSLLAGWVVASFMIAARTFRFIER